MQKKEIFVKLIVKTNMINSFFSKFLVKFLRSSIEYILSRAVLGALLGALKVALHCVKSVQIRSFFWSVFSCIWTEYGDLRRFTFHSLL